MLETITDPNVRAALTAWQNNDKPSWLSCFSDAPDLYDDGNRRDFAEFTNAIGTERFVSIDRIEDDGRTVIGQFHSDQWGDFRTYFTFTPGPDGRFTRLDIGQAAG
ncbi:hypothetical protein JJJ17_10565 [Paracoccus caeni]|uniref:Nuclear transport factor 2 family protein n=1 Tax=Paracoccus caeni TaxID=657651 RepID=A0A934SJ99_9RHOB|nr:hypothetical protein [Paracoccus caeni]MBK4216367.1 hypothetical protein [Paracoccus caeni]